MRVDDQLPSVAPEERRPVFYETAANPRTFGAGVDRAIAGLGDATEKGGIQLADAALARQGLYNETIAKEADVKASRALIDLQYDPKTGYMAKKGKDAVSSYDDTLKTSEEIRREFLDSLPNDQAKKMFDAVFLRRLQYAQEGIGSHASRENKTWMLETSKSREASIASEGILNWNNLDRFMKVTVPGIAGEVRSRGELEGQDEITITQNTRNAIDAAHVARLKAMMNYDVKGALDQLNEIKPQLTAAGQLHAEEAVIHGIRLSHEQMVWAEQAKARAVKERDEKIGQDFFTKLTEKNLTPRDIDSSNLSAPHKVHWYQLVGQQSRQDAKLDNNNPTVVQDVLRRITLPYGNKDKITDINEVYAMVGEGVSLNAAQTLVKMVVDQRTPEGYKLSEARNRAFMNFRPQFVHDTTTGPDVQGGKDFFEFQQAVIDREERLRRDKKDPHEVYNPSSPEYIGNMVDQYKATFRQRIERQVQSIRDTSGKITRGGQPTQPPRKPGEGIEDYLKRRDSAGTAK